MHQKHLKTLQLIKSGIKEKREQEKKTEKGLEKEVKTTPEGVVAMEAKLHDGNRECSRERAAWLPS